MVEMKDFITHSLLEIVSGVDHARRDVLFGDAVAPLLAAATQIDPAYQVAWHEGHFWTSVHFDIAVTARTVTEGGGKVGFKIPVVELGVKVGGEHERTSEGVSRVQFSVPLRLPKEAKTV